MKKHVARRPLGRPRNVASVSALAVGTLVTVAAASGWGASDAPTAATTSDGLVHTASIWDSSTVPQHAASSDTRTTTVGTSFVANQPGKVTKLEFYKSSANTGRHVAKLWNASGDLLAKTRFTDETASGWQRSQLADPVRLRAGHTYTVSYVAPHGGFSRTADSFTDPATGAGTATTTASTDALTPTGGVQMAGTGSPTAEPTSTTAYFADVVYKWRKRHNNQTASAQPTTAAPTPADPTTTAPAPADPTTTAPAPADPTTTAPPPADPTTTAPAPSTPTSSAPTGAAPTTHPASGVPAGTTLQSSGSITVTQPGTVIDGKNVNGVIRVQADNVTIRNTRVTSGDWTVIKIDNGVKGATIDHVEVDGRGYSGSPGSVGIFGPATVTHTDVHSVENGIIPMSGSVIRDSWIHTLEASGSDPHYDGFQLDGGQGNILIENNTVDLTNQDRTSTVMIDNDFGSVTDVTVNANRLLGGSFTVYADGKFSSDPITGIAYVNNRMGMGGYGYGLIRNASVKWSGNYDDKSGQTVNP